MSDSLIAPELLHARRNQRTRGRQLLLIALQHVTREEAAARVGVSGSAVTLWASGESLPARSRRACLEQTYGIASASWSVPPRGQKGPQVTKAEELKRLHAEVPWLSASASLSYARTIVARHRETKRLKAAGLPVSLSRGFGAEAARWPMGRRPAAPPTTSQPIAKGPVMTARQQSKSLDQRIDALEAHARAQFLATRPDLAREFVALMNTKPLAEVRALVKALPKATVRSAPKAPGSGPAKDPEIARVDRMMGRALLSPAMKCEERDGRLYLGRAPAR